MIQTATVEGDGGRKDVPDCTGVGIVIGVPEPMATELRRARASCGDPMAAVIPAHITVVTTTETNDWEAMAAHVRRVARRHAAFDVTLRGTATFRPVSPVVYVRVDEGYEECTALHKEMQSGPLARDLPFPYHPHVTVAHDVSEAGMDMAMHALRDYESRFTVSTVGLYEHDVSGLWKLREEVALRR
ncbi:2'-5' RNA ligase family protein [Arthrobacter gengyunqii]|uniref:2'-5' RNA ligase family protein n=1 Tax=Arthrobacter gengyunqii TaxID=2886940 RepID=A0A9X1S6V9_9MICC|nr:2'-5' RNA ligase family protein [Arthrobacter gengyunqii]MCC3266699.1 2'-5' RNA ligase family protein [Arthrobacter gengyunqii]MCC3269546.1 2'-5' RNA ligase family protein [Arthrobacter gengyunqii]UOY97016.1 2'-5' RNA ligase family protein [Arthrobacter gengyunqii]